MRNEKTDPQKYADLEFIKNENHNFLKNVLQNIRKKMLTKHGREEYRIQVAKNMHPKI